MDQRGLSVIISILSEISELKGDNLRDAGEPDENNAPKWYKAAFELEKIAQILKDQHRL